MLLSIGIKNIILVFLIILILHFFLNIMIDKKIFRISSQEKFANQSVDMKKEMLDFVYEPKEEKPEKNQVLVSLCCDTSTKSPENAETEEASATEVVEEKTVKADSNIIQNKKNMMIIKEYEEDTFDGLNAFDGFDLNFQPYESSCKN